MKLVVASTRPGLIRGGQRHVGVETYALDHFNEEQLLDILHEPALSVVIGEVVTPSMITGDESDDEQPGPLVERLHDHFARSVYGERSWLEGYFVDGAGKLQRRLPVAAAATIDQGLPSHTEQLAPVTGADLLDARIITDGASGTTVDPKEAGILAGNVHVHIDGAPLPQSAAVAEAEAETIARMHVEEAEMAAAKPGAPAIAPGHRGRRGH